VLLENIDLEEQNPDEKAKIEKLREEHRSKALLESVRMSEVQKGKKGFCSSCTIL